MWNLSQISPSMWNLSMYLKYLSNLCKYLPQSKTAQNRKRKPQKDPLGPDPLPISELLMESGMPMFCFKTSHRKTCLASEPPSQLRISVQTTDFAPDPPPDFEIQESDPNLSYWFRILLNGSGTPPKHFGPSQEQPSTQDFYHFRTFFYHFKAFWRRESHQTRIFHILDP